MSNMSDLLNEEAIIKSMVESFDWNQLSLEQLNLIKPQISKAIYLKQHQLKLAQSKNSVTKNSQYKATLSQVFPHRLRSSLSEYQSCIFIISLGSKNFCEPKRLKASIEWISKNFKSCIVLVGDSIYRLTLEVKGDSNNEEYRSKALYLGQQFLDENAPLFQEYAENCNFVFKLTSEIEKEPNFEVYNHELQNLYQSSDSFAKLVNSFADNYLSRIEQVKPEVDLPSKRQNHLAINYLLEESALVTCLAEQGWSIFVYPGSIKTFEEIAEGLHPEIPFSLKQIIWVSLRLKQKKTR